MIVEVLRQRRQITRDGRRPERIVAPPDAINDLVMSMLCTGPYTGPGRVSMPDGVVGYLGGLPVYVSTDEHGWRVVAEDE